MSNKGNQAAWLDGQGAQLRVKQPHSYEDEHVVNTTTGRRC